MTPMLKIDRNPKNILPYLLKLVKTIQSLRLSTNSSLKNVYDEIEGLLFSTIYKIRNLK